MSHLEEVAVKAENENSRKIRQVMAHLAVREAAEMAERASERMIKVVKKVRR